MKRLLVGGLAALGLVLTASPVKADCSFEYSCSRHLSYVHTSKSRCFSYSAHANPLPCCGPAGCGGPALWNGMAAYGAGYGVPAYAAPVAALPAAVAPAPAAPAFQAPAPKSSGNSSGLQQTGYFYYGQSNASNYGYGSSSGYNYYGAGYGYGYGYGAGYYQAPNYWYDN